MRQVPDYYIVGNGRMAKHFCHYLDLLNIPYVQWHRQKNQSFKDFIQTCSRLYLLISDQAVVELANLPELKHHQLIHFSGALVHPHAHSAHPLMTFSHQLYDKLTYQKIPFIIEQEGPPGYELIPGLPNQVIHLPRSVKAFYHSLLVIGGNFSTLLWKTMLDEGSQLGIPQSALLNYCQQTLNNFSQDPQGSLTGPIARNDRATIEKNLLALKDHPIAEVYQAFINVYLEAQHEKHS